MIETAVKGDLFLDTKLIIPENKLEAIRIMNELHPVVGGQPTHEQDQPNDNNPILDLACTLANIHASGVGEHADLRPIQNESPKYFYGKGFMSGISSLKGNGILVVFGQWRDASGRYAIKQFYYTDKEISYRNAVSEDKWSKWIDVLTGNSSLDYNKLLNVPITSTLSDDKTKIASIFSVNDVNRKAVNAQKTANTANANAIDAMNEAKKKVDPKDVKSESLKNGGLYITGSNLVPKLEAGMHGLAMASSFLANNDGLDFAGFPNTFLHYYVQANYLNSKTRLVCFFNGYGNGEWYISSTTNEGVWKQPARFYSTENTKIIKGFLRASGNLTPLTEEQLTSSLADYKDRAASIYIVNQVNRDVVVAQKTANTADGKAANAQVTANNAYSIAQSKQDKLSFTGTGNVARMSEVDKKHPLNESVFYNLKTGITLNSPPIASGFMQVNDISHNNLPSGFYPYGTLFQGLHKYEGNVAQIYVPHTNRGHILYRGALNHDWNTLALTSDIPKNTASLSENGWWKCATTGVIHQWGTVNYSGNPGETSIWVNFPIAFNNVLNIQLTRKVGAAGRADADGGANIVTLENNRVQVDLQAYGLNSGNLRGVTWYAIGY